MLREDPALPFLEMAWSPSQMQEFLNRQVLPAVWPGQEVTAVVIDEMTYKPGKQCQILSSLKFADPTRGQSRWVVVTFAKKNKLGEIYRRHYGGEGGASTRPVPRSVVFLPKYSCLVEFFPRDWGLPSLAWAVEPRGIAPFLSQDGSKAEHSGWLPKVEVLTYRLRRRRCVLRYVVDAPDGSNPKEVIGKVYQSGAQAMQVAHVLNRLRPQAAACGLIIPKPLRVVQDRSLLLMERVPGTGLQLLMEQAQTPQQFKEVIGLAAAALASLHRLHLESQEVQSLQTQVEEFRKRAAPLHLVAPLLAQQVEALLQQIVQSGARSTVVAPSLIHGDFSLSQLLLDKSQLGVVDFDTASLGDPAIDVGNFMARLYHIAVSRASNTFRQLATYFLSEYQARLPEQRVVERVPLFLSTSLVWRALRAFERRPYQYGQAGSDSRPVRLLQEAAACLSRQ